MIQEGLREIEEICTSLETGVFFVRVLQPKCLIARLKAFASGILDIWDCWKRTKERCIKTLDQNIGEHNVKNNIYFLNERHSVQNQK